jgi:polar amino acid transport system substrate-binding protein
MTHSRREVSLLAAGAASLALLASPLTALGQDASPAAESAAPMSAAPAGEALVSEACQAANLGDALKNPGRLTLSTDNPSFPPWWGGDPSVDPDSGWEVSYPPSGEGLEGGVAYAVAHALGFTDDQIDWIQNTEFTLAFQPGEKPFDWHMAQVSILPERAEAVDFSDSYFDANQTLVANAGTEIENAASVADLKPYTLGAQVGTTSLAFIEETIQPDAEPQVFNTNADAIQALENGQIDGIIVDIGSAFFVVAVQLSNGTIVGQFPSSANVGQVGMVLEKESPLTACVNEALALVRDSGQLQAIYDATITQAQDVPVLE